MKINQASVAATVVLLAGSAIIGIRGRGPSPSYLLRSLAALMLFIVFMSLLSGRHVPLISGYVYGCTLAVFIAMIAGLAFASASGGAAKAVILGIALLMAVVQLTNFHAIDKDWIALHNDGWTKREYEKTLPIAKDGRAKSRKELSSIWAAWKAGQLNAYLEANEISSGAVFLVFELRFLETQKKTSIPRSR